MSLFNSQRQQLCPQYSGEAHDYLLPLTLAYQKINIDPRR
jgi:hypothetical protein